MSIGGRREGAAAGAVEPKVEYDKAPEDVAEALMCLAGEGLEFRVAGREEPRAGTPGASAPARGPRGTCGAVRVCVLGGRVCAVALAIRCLVSAARHEFFGQAVVRRFIAAAGPFCLGG